MGTIGNMLRGKQIHRTLNDNICVHISYCQALNAKMYALNILRGTPEESFLRLPIYCYSLEKKNLGTITYIKTSDDKKFEYLFMAIGCAVRVFQRCLHPIIINDGAKLKGKYFDTIFIAVGMDGNNQILPIAFGVGKTESGESWIWFLSRLKECIGDMPSLAIISDRANSIEIVIQSVFPNAYHELCCRHLLMNMRTKIDKQERTKILFWEDAKEYQDSDFKESLSRLCRALNDDCQTWQRQNW
uniref:MULE transposase domain-containing protein n=1 Tax=Lactuca sativa TaxID=4236 RepID=A0A9R1XD91_LACSA|nr:hypothetical protein LSAT_V11C500295360 [Lactuca sativa]